MSDVELEETQNGVSGHDTGSILEQLRARHSELLSSSTTDLPVPGYHGEMVARYKVLDSHEMASIGVTIRKTIKDQTEQQIAAMIDMLLKSCIEIFWRTDEGPLVPLSKVLQTDTEVRYDQNLASFLGHDVQTARAALQAVFGDNDVAIMRHAMSVQDWMADTTKDANGDFAGEL